MLRVVGAGCLEEFVGGGYGGLVLFELSGCSCGVEECVAACGVGCCGLEELPAGFEGLLVVLGVVVYCCEVG